MNQYSQSVLEYSCLDPKKWDWSDFRASVAETRKLLSELLERGERFEQKLNSWKDSIQTEQRMKKTQHEYEQEAQLHAALLYTHLADVTYTAALQALK
jgi:hypothetical protein